MTGLLHLTMALVLMVACSATAAAQVYQGDKIWLAVQNECRGLPDDDGQRADHPVQLLLGANLSSRERCQLSRALFFQILQETAYGLAIVHEKFTNPNEGRFLQLLDDTFEIYRDGGTKREPKVLKRLVRVVNNSRDRVLLEFLLMETPAAQCVYRNLMLAMPRAFGQDEDPTSWELPDLGPGELGEECPSFDFLTSFHGDEGERFIASLTGRQMDRILGQLRRMANVMRCEHPEIHSIPKPSPECPEGWSIWSNPDSSQLSCERNPDDVTVTYPECQRFVTHQ